MRLIIDIDDEMVCNDIKNKEDMRKEYKRGITDAYKINPPI